MKMADRKGVANSDYMVDPFPGISWAGQLAPGSAPVNSPPPDAVETTFTNDRGEPWNRLTASTHGTTEPGQLQDGFIGLGASDIADTGAGHGSGSHYPRRPGQQPDGAR
jgi:hypothetical protein